MPDKWLKDLNNRITDFFTKATPEEIRDLLKKSHYHEYTGINPDDLEILSPKVAMSSLESDSDVFEHPYLTHLVWRKAWESRFCPPDILLFKKDRSKECNSHLATCRVCEEKITSKLDMKILGNLAEKMQDILPKPSIVKPSVSVGQIWSLSRKLDGWGEGDRYFKAPRVLVVEKTRGEAGTIKVAQIYADDSFMDEGDVWLDNSYGFAESWNIFTVKRKDLEKHWGNLSNTLLQKVQTAAESIRPFIPRHEMIPLFRNLEIEVGRFCALKSVPSAVPVPPWIEVLNGIKAAISEVQSWIIDVTKEGLDAISGYLLPEAVPAFATREATRGATRGTKPYKKKLEKYEKEKLEKLTNKIYFLPVKFHNYTRKLQIDFRWIKKMPAVAPALQVALRGKDIPMAYVSWESWDSENPAVVIKNYSVSDEEKKKSKSLLRVRYVDQTVRIDILYDDPASDC